MLDTAAKCDDLLPEITELGLTTSVEIKPNIVSASEHRERLRQGLGTTSQITKWSRRWT